MSSQVARRTARQEMDRPRIAAAQLRHRQSRGIGHEAASMPLAFLCRPPAHPVPCRRRYGRPFWGCHGLAGRRLAAGQNGWSEPTRPGRYGCQTTWVCSTCTRRSCCRQRECRHLASSRDRRPHRCDGGGCCRQSRPECLARPMLSLFLASCRWNITRRIDLTRRIDRCCFHISCCRRGVRIRVTCASYAHVFPKCRFTQCLSSPPFSHAAGIHRGKP